MTNQAIQPITIRVPIRMASRLRATVLDTNGNSWPDEVDHLRALLGAPHNPALLPAHFLKVTLARIGGRALRFEQDGRFVGVGFLFPRPGWQDAGVHPAFSSLQSLLCPSIRKR